MWPQERAAVGVLELCWLRQRGVLRAPAGRYGHALRRARHALPLQVEIPEQCTAHAHEDDQPMRPLKLHAGTEQDGTTVHVSDKIDDGTRQVGITVGLGGWGRRASFRREKALPLIY